jgi:hypothetical protein
VYADSVEQCTKHDRGGELELSDLSADALGDKYRVQKLWDTGEDKLLGGDDPYLRFRVTNQHDVPFVLKTPRRQPEGRGRSRWSALVDEMRAYKEIGDRRFPSPVDQVELLSGRWRGCLYTPAPGVALREHLRVHRRLAPDLAVQIALQVAQALAAAHRAGFVHRALSPSNIFVDIGSGDVGVVVTDLGLVRQGSLPGEDVRGQKVLRAEAGYTSPEQWLGKATDARSDLYALGVVLFEMLTGERPFSAETPSELRSKVLSGKALSVLDVRPGLSLPHQLDRMVQQMLSADPAHRPRSTDDVIEGLTELKRGYEARELAGGWGAPSVQPSLQAASPPLRRMPASGGAADADAIVRELEGAGRRGFSLSGVDEAVLITIDDLDPTERVVLATVESPDAGPADDVTDLDILGPFSDAQLARNPLTEPLVRAQTPRRGGPALAAVSGVGSPAVSGRDETPPVGIDPASVPELASELTENLGSGMKRIGRLRSSPEGPARPPREDADAGPRRPGRPSSVESVGEGVPSAHEVVYGGPDAASLYEVDDALTLVSPPWSRQTRRRTPPPSPPEAPTSSDATKATKKFVVGVAVAAALLAVLVIALIGKSNRGGGEISRDVGVAEVEAPVRHVPAPSGPGITAPAPAADRRAEIEHSFPPARTEPAPAPPERAPLELEAGPPDVQLARRPADPEPDEPARGRLEPTVARPSAPGIAPAKAAPRRPTPAAPSTALAPKPAEATEPAEREPTGKLAPLRGPSLSY